MKKTILLFGALLLLMNAAFSQNAFFTADFAGGIPAGWINSGTDNTGQVRNNMWKYTTVGNQNFSYNPRVALNSPTKANGWILFDSDSLDNAASPVPAGQRGYLTTTPINCTGHNQVLIEWWQQFRVYNATLRFVVSNGTTSDTLEANPTLNFNFATSPNGQRMQYDVTDVVANQPNVTITVLWESDQGYYHWQVDDIHLIDAPANDLRLTTARSFNYYAYPYSETDTIGYYGFVTNVGTAPQPNTRVALTIKKGATQVFTDTTALGVTLPYNVDSPLIGDATYYPGNTAAAKGTYNTYMVAFSDSVNQLPFMNTDTNAFVVNDSTLAVEDGNLGGSFITYLPGQYSSSGSSSSAEWANIFYLPNADTITSISTAFDNVFTYTGPNAGPTVQATIYSLPDILTATSTTFLTNQVLTTEVKKITDANVNSVVVLKVDPTSSAATPGNYATVLQPGFYAVSINSPSNDSLISIYNSLNGRGYFGLPGGEINNGSLTAYTNTHFLIRMNFGHGYNTLYANFNRTGGSTAVRVGQSVTFSASSNASNSATYVWDFTSTQGYTYASQSGKTVKDTFQYADSITVCLTVTDGTEVASVCKVVPVRELGVGINDISALSNLSMIPNPTTGKVTIAADGLNGATTISVVNMIGEVVKTYNETANGDFSKTYNLSDLSSGLYIVRIQNNGNSVSNRLSITK